MSLTPSNNTAQSTTEAHTLSGNHISNHNNATQRQSGRSNAFEVPIWLILCYCAIFLCAIIGNLLVISTLMQNRRLRTITNVFLLNLAISDILLGVLCMPITLVGTLLRHFIFGEFFCKLIQFSQAASVAVSSWTLVAISCERYYAICHPLRSRRWQTRSHAYKIIACIWCGSMLCMLPIALFSQLMPTSRQGLLKCRENWPHFVLPYERSYNIFLDLALLVLPLLMLSVAYVLITHTLYVGMHIEKAMVFGGKHANLNSSLQQKSNSGDLLEKSFYLTTSSLSMNTTSSSRFKLNLSLRNHGGPINNTPSYKNITSNVSSNRHENWESTCNHTNGFAQQDHPFHPNLQPTVRKLNQRHTSQSNHQQQQIMFRPGEQKQEQPNHHQSYVKHQQQQESQQQPCCCEPFLRFCCKRLNPSLSNSTNASSTRKHLYCMRFATVKTTQTDNDGNDKSNFCTADCCDGVDSGSRAAINGNCNNLHATPAIMTLPSSPTASTSTSTATTYRYQMQQQQYNPPLQHNHLRCYCVVQQIGPQFNDKADTNKVLNNKRSLKVTGSVLRRNNTAKNLESKNRVVKMLSVLVLEFFICWTPLYVINTVAMYIGSAIYEYIDYTSISVLQLLAYSSSCCNPITYCFMNANFRRAFLDTFRGKHWCGKRFKRKRPTAQNDENFCLAGSIRLNSCTAQTVIESPRL